MANFKVEAVSSFEILEPTDGTTRIYVYVFLWRNSPTRA
jgi:hypothetical protein